MIKGKRYGAVHGLLVMALAGLAVLLFGPAAPVGAGTGHGGDKIRLAVEKLTAEPADSGYQVTAVLVDRATGSPATGFQTSVSGTSDGQSFPETPMTAEPGGIYRAAVPAAPGEWTVNLRSASIPGLPDAIPLETQIRHSFPVAPASASAAGAGTSPSDSGGSSIAPVLAGAAGLLAVGAIVMVAKRRRPAGVPQGASTAG